MRLPTLNMQSSGEGAVRRNLLSEESPVRLAPAISALGLVLSSVSHGAAASESNSSGATGSEAFPERATLTVSRNLSVSQARTSLVGALPQLQRLQLQEPVVRSLRSGRTLYRFPLRYQGLPVLGGRATLVVDSQGRAEARTGAPMSYPDSVVAVVSLERALDVASRRAQVNFTGENVRLAIVPTVDGSRLAYVAYRGVVGGLPYAPMVQVDAETGEVLTAWNTVHFDRLARVHEENPTSTPGPVEVTLNVEAGSENLINDLVESRNCIDNGTVDEVFGNIKAHHCDLEQHATADEFGDFLAHVYTGDKLEEDTYAEVAMFYHLNKVYEVWMGLGLDPLETQPLPGIVNLRMPQGFDTFDTTKLANGELPLVPYDNAFYAGSNPMFSNLFGLPGAALWFGQGTHADFAYDGDVVYHEFGHAVIDSTIALVGGWHVDDQGAMPSPGSINEGLADYISSVVTDDGVVGEYAGGSFGGSAIRTIENTDTCPEGIGGEVHVDSTFFSGAMWEARQGLTAEQKPLFDAAVLDALKAAPSGDVSYADVAEQFVESVEATSGLGSEVGDVLEQSFTDRGVLPRCERLIELTEGKVFKGANFGGASGVFVPNTGSIPGSVDYAPGALQFHVALAEGATELNIKASLPQFASSGGGFGGGGEFKAGLLVYFGDAPLTFKAGVAEQGEAVELADVTTSIDEVYEVPEGATDVYFMIVNFGDADGMMSNVRAEVTVEEVPPGNEDGTGGEGGEGAGGAGDEPVVGGDPIPPTTDAGGCGCRVAGPSSNVPAGAGLLALLAAGLVPWARRRAVRSRRSK
jgi:MYXO-CTERM domain-containing protein